MIQLRNRSHQHVTLNSRPSGKGMLLVCFLSRRIEKAQSIADKAQDIHITAWIVLLLLCLSAVRQPCSERNVRAERRQLLILLCSNQLLKKRN